MAHVSGLVCLDLWSDPRRSATGPVRPACRVRPVAARAPTSPQWTMSHARGSPFQLHSRPPRQRLPSSLVIESASASTSCPHLSFAPRHFRSTLATTQDQSLRVAASFQNRRRRPAACRFESQSLSYNVSVSSRTSQHQRLQSVGEIRLSSNPKQCRQPTPTASRLATARL